MQPNGRDGAHGITPPRDLAAALHQPGIGLFLDFDGTLADLVVDPTQVRIHEGCAAALRRLVALGVPVAVVSGRVVEDLRARCGLGGVWLAGVYGAELAEPSGGCIWSFASPDERVGLEAFATLARGLEGDGVWIEDKRIAIAAHLRRIEDRALRGQAQARLVGSARTLARAHPVTWVAGDEVVEVRMLGVTKAAAVRTVMARWPITLPIAVGDDATDEEMFAQVRERGGCAIKVGLGTTSAGDCLRDVGQVAQFLDALADRIGRV